MAEITEWVKKIWKNRITEFPTRRELTKEDGSSEIVTVTRNEGTVSEEGDAFDADTMNNLEERIDAGFADVNRKLNIKYDANTDTVQIYYNGQWVDWKKAYLQATLLFDGDNGGTNNDIIIGWTSLATQYGTSYTVGANNITVSGTGGSTSGTVQPRFRTTNQIDLTNYSKMIVELSAPGNGSLGFTLTNTKPSSLVRLNSSTAELDISNLSGSYYLWFEGSVNFSGTTVISKIALQ